MKCLTTARTYYAGNHEHSELYAAPKDGTPRKLLTSTPTLRLTPHGYELTTAEGEVIGRGKSRQPRQICESLARRGLKVTPTIDINTPHERIRTSYDGFINDYGGDWMPEKRRYFKAFAQHAEADDEGNKEYTAIGLIEYERRQTLSIGSFYAPGGYTNRQAYGEVARYIEAQLDDGEHAIIKYKGTIPPKVHLLYTDRLTFKPAGKQKRSMAEVKTLAEDAVQRRGTIEQRFSEPIKSGVDE